MAGGVIAVRPAHAHGPTTVFAILADPLGCRLRADESESPQDLFQERAYGGNAADYHNNPAFGGRPDQEGRLCI